MAIECIETQEWIEEEISKPVTQWVEQTEQKCKKGKWYDPRRWLCYLVTTLVAVAVWVTVKVGKWVVRTVCKVVGAVASFLGDFFNGLWNIVAGIFTGDWRRIVDGLIQMGAGFIDSLLKLLRVVSLLDTLDYVTTEIQRNRLKVYVRTKLGFKYSGQEFQDIVDNLRIDHGAFGYRIPMRAIRTYLDSETPSQVEPGVPNLVVLHENRATTGINLRELCGFDFTERFWNRKRYKTLKKGLHAGGGGGEVENPISEDELDTYLSSRGAQGPKFIVLCMRDDVLNTKLRAAELKGRELGLMPQWTQEPPQEVTLPEHIKHTNQPDDLVNFLIDPIKRQAKVKDDPNTPMNEADETAALADLCTPVAVGIFRYTTGLRGLSACLEGSSCRNVPGVSGPPFQNPHDASGVTFIDNKPDIIWKYVPIHELGHYFGLCHVEGLDRIMYTPKGPQGQSLGTWEVIKKSLTWRTLYSLIIIKGEPSFTLEEGMQAWDYIIEHFPAQCLGVKTRIFRASAVGEDMVRDVEIGAGLASRGDSANMARPDSGDA